MADLTVMSQAVLDATHNAWAPEDPQNLRRCVAAALRSLDEQVGYEVLRVRCVNSSLIHIIANELDGLEVRP